MQLHFVLKICFILALTAYNITFKLLTLFPNNWLLKKHYNLEHTYTVESRYVKLGLLEISVKSNCSEVPLYTWSFTT